MAAAESSGLADLVVLALFGLIIWFLHWLGRKPMPTRRKPWAPAAWPEISGESAIDYNPGGPITDRQAQKLFEAVLQAAIRQKADTILLDAISGRPKVRLRLDGQFQELTGVGRRAFLPAALAQARRCAGLAAAGDSSTVAVGSFLRLYHRGHLSNAQWRLEDKESSFSFYEVSRRNRAFRFDLESFPSPHGEALKISLKPEMSAENTHFDLGFAAASEGKYIEAVRSRSGIVLLTGPCNSGKSTATYRALALLRDQGRKIITVEWPMERKIDGVLQYHLHDLPDTYGMVGTCLQRAIRRKPDVLMLQNIDWVDDDDAQAALDFAAAGGLLITAIHVTGCANAFGIFQWRHLMKQRQDAAGFLKIIVAPRRLFMVCMHCAEEYLVPARTLVQAGLDSSLLAAGPGSAKVTTWRGRGCPLCENTGELGSIAVYEVMELTGKMKRFIENANAWSYDQIHYLERQAWLHGMRTQRELAMERVLAGDISLKEAMLNTRKPSWLTAAQASRRRLAGGEA